jgi:signal transduction histidine kinase
MRDKSSGGSVQPTAAASPSPLLSGNVSDKAAIEYVIAIRAAERSRIAQELHDSTLQLLALIQLNLGRMRRQSGEDLLANIAECEEMISEVGRHIRKISSAGS